MKRVLIALLAIGIMLIGYQIYNSPRVHAQSSTTTRILIPWITGSDAGYTSLVTITNAGMDPWGGTGASGTCGVNAYTGGVAYPSTGSASIAPIGSGQAGGSQSQGGAQLFLPGTTLTFTESQILQGTGLTLANSGQRAYVMLTCNFPYAHAQLALVNPGGVVTFLPGYIIPPNRSYATGPEQLLQ